MADVQTDFDYGRFTPVDSSGKAYSVFNSAFKNIRWALPYVNVHTITASDMANLPGIAYDFYGDVSLWRMLLAYNGLQDPIQDIYPGVQLKMPSKASVIDYISKQQDNSNPQFNI
jgi:nucleoid-associated protein YgaU